MYCKNTILFALLLGLLLIPVSFICATEVNRMSLCDLESFPGKVINMEITLTGNSPEERTGFWRTHYKEIEGDNDKMDITTWITIEPENYTIKQEETKIFNIKVSIPKDASPGLWGATSAEAGKQGHSDERRTYIIFKDAITGGNVYSGLLLPVTINVLPNPNPLIPMINFAKKNITTIILSIVIIALLVKLSSKEKTKLPKKTRKTAKKQ